VHQVVVSERSLSTTVSSVASVVAHCAPANLSLVPAILKQNEAKWSPKPLCPTFMNISSDPGPMVAQRPKNAASIAVKTGTEFTGSEETRTEFTGSEETGTDLCREAMDQLTLVLGQLTIDPQTLDAALKNFVAKNEESTSKLENIMAIWSNDKFSDCFLPTEKYWIDAILLLLSTARFDENLFAQGLVDLRTQASTQGRELMTSMMKLLQQLDLSNCAGRELTADEIRRFSRVFNAVDNWIAENPSSFSFSCPLDDAQKAACYFAQYREASLIFLKEFLERPNEASLQTIATTILTIEKTIGIKTAPMTELKHSLIDVISEGLASNKVCEADLNKFMKAPNDHLILLLNVIRKVFYVEETFAF